MAAGPANAAAGDDQRNAQLSAGEQAKRPCICHWIAEQGLHQYAGHPERRSGDQPGDDAREAKVLDDLCGNRIVGR